MPRILCYTPPWLLPPSPGSRIFSDPHTVESPSSPSKRSSQLEPINGTSASQTYQGRRKLLARRGTEVFVVVGNKIRWTDLPRAKDDWAEATAQPKSHRSLEAKESKESGAEVTPYRTLTVPVYQKIRQVTISPSGVFLAILTEHTIHVAVLPDSTRLRDHDQSPIKLKTHQLGPTTHVIPQSPLVCALWHPLAASGNSTDCLLTLTAESAVRLWELDRSNHWSFDRPSLAIDLKKLVDGTSCDQDFEPSGFGKTRGFSADVFDMEASSACFGGTGSDEEDGWASMTLWVSMRNGDIYALCPLLPSTWKPSSTIIPSLTTDVVSKMSSVDRIKLTPDQSRALTQQYEWVQEIDSAEPLFQEHGDHGTVTSEILQRPVNPSAIPRLQGPFELDLEDYESDFEVSDIHVIAAKLDLDEIISDEEADYGDMADTLQDGLAATIVCLTTTNHKFHVLLDLDGVSGQWLPKTGRGEFSVPDSDAGELILVETLFLAPSDTSRNLDDPSNWPTISPDITSRYDLYITSSKHINFVSLSEWVSRLQAEISSALTGLSLRLRIACDESIALKEDILSVTTEHDPVHDVVLSDPLIFRDSELGHFLVTSAAHRAYAVCFDIPETAPITWSTTQPQAIYGSPMQQSRGLLRTSISPALEITMPRDSYVPPTVFYDYPTAPLKQFLTMNLPQRQKLTMKQEIRLSPATLDLISSTHRTVSIQTSQIENAAADLFRRCERLREELGNQVKQMSELSAQMQRIRGGVKGDDKEEYGFEKRMDMVAARQQKLVARHEALRRQVSRAGAGARAMSPKELVWVREMNSLAEMVGIDHQSDTEGGNSIRGNDLISRFERVKEITDELLNQTKTIEKNQNQTADQSTDQGDGRPSSSSSTTPQRSSISGSSMLVPSKLQKARITDAMRMVEREGALIEAVMARLERLNVE